MAEGVAHRGVAGHRLEQRHRPPVGAAGDEEPVPGERQPELRLAPGDGPAGRGRRRSARDHLEREPGPGLLQPGDEGAQGGEVEASVRAGVSPAGLRGVFNSSRGILYASSGPDFAEKAREAAIALRDEINAARFPG